MDEEKRGGESYSYGAVGGLGGLEEMRCRGEEGNKGVEVERGGGICATFHSRKQKDVGEECVSSKLCYVFIYLTATQ